MAEVTEFNRPPVHGFDYYDNMTITLGEWYEMGFYRPDEDDWKWDYYNEEQYKRVCVKFLNRYWYREVAVLPSFRWKKFYLEKFNELMPKYKILYKLMDEDWSLLQNEDEFYKSRDIFSDFPATMLGDNQDYASTGTDREYERVKNGSPLDKYLQFADRFQDVDVLLLDDVEILFGSVLTSTMPLF